MVILLVLFGGHLLGSTVLSPRTCWKDVPEAMSLSDDTACYGHLNVLTIK